MRTTDWEQKTFGIFAGSVWASSRSATSVLKKSEYIFCVGVRMSEFA